MFDFSKNDLCSISNDFSIWFSNSNIFFSSKINVRYPKIFQCLIFYHCPIWTIFNIRYANRCSICHRFSKSGNRTGSLFSSAGNGSWPIFHTHLRKSEQSLSHILHGQWLKCLRGESCACEESTTFRYIFERRSAHHLPE